MTRADADPAPLLSPDGLWAVVPNAGDPDAEPMIWGVARFGVIYLLFVGIGMSAVMVVLHLGHGMTSWALTGALVVMSPIVALRMWRPGARRDAKRELDRRRDRLGRLIAAKGPAGELVACAFRLAMAESIAARDVQSFWRVWRDMAANGGPRRPRVIFRARRLVPPQLSSGALPAPSPDDRIGLIDVEAQTRMLYAAAGIGCVPLAALWAAGWHAAALIGPLVAGTGAYFILWARRASAIQRDANAAGVQVESGRVIVRERGVLRAWSVSDVLLVIEDEARGRLRIDGRSDLLFVETPETEDPRMFRLLALLHHEHNGESDTECE